MSVQQLRAQITKPWHSLALYGGLLGVLAAGLVWKLQTLVPGYTEAEAQTLQASLDLGYLFDNPFNAPFLLITKALSYALANDLFATRVTAALFGSLTLVVFAVVLRRWHDTRTAVLGTLLFGLSAWFLHTARLGTPDVLFFGLFIVVACGYWAKQTGYWLALLSCFLATAALLYVPGMIWFVLLGIIWQWKTIDRLFKKHLATVTLAGIAVLAAVAPLVWALYRNTSLIKPFLALPAEWPAPLEIARNLLKVPFHFFVRNEANPAIWLGTAPIFDIFSLTMFVLGGYLYLRHFRLARTPLFIAIGALTLGLMAVGSSITFSVFIPFAYLVIAAGVAHLFNQWFMVFPRNPIARGIGWVLISILVALVCGYHLTHYFVGWPHATATHEVYTIQPPQQHLVQ